DERQVRRLAPGVVGLAGHRDVTLDPLLRDGAGELAHILQPLLQLLRRADRTVEEPAIPGLDLLPGLGLELLGQPAPGKRLRYIEGRVHASNSLGFGCGRLPHPTSDGDATATRFRAGPAPGTSRAAAGLVPGVAFRATSGPARGGR